MGKTGKYWTFFGRETETMTWSKALELGAFYWGYILLTTHLGAHPMLSVCSASKKRRGGKGLRPYQEKKYICFSGSKYIILLDHSQMVARLWITL